MFQAVQIRIARPTLRLDALAKFYQMGLGMVLTGQFSDHDGYDGIMLGMPDNKIHLEFTSHTNLKPEDLPRPTKEHLLVLYFDNPANYQKATNRLRGLNCHPVSPENPYWEGKSETYEDPDGWRVVLFNGVFG